MAVQAESFFCLSAANSVFVAGRAGVPFEVMGLMLGDWVDEYTVKVMDVFAMPQRGTSMSVEAVDEGYQIEMMEMLKPTGRGEVVVGWYHSHPGWDVWLSSVDQATQEVSAASPARCDGQLPSSAVITPPPPAPLRRLSPPLPPRPPSLSTPAVV